MTLLETEPDLPAETVAGDQIGRGHSQFARWGLTSHDVLVLAAGALFCAGTGPFEFGGWTLRMAALLGGLPLGVVLLVRLAWNRDRLRWPRWRSSCGRSSPRWHRERRGVRSLVRSMATPRAL